MRTPTRGTALAALLTSLVTSAALLTGPSAPATASEAAAGAITPGVQMFTEGAQCTGNFVFRDKAGRTYVGYAAHCAGKGEATDTDGCSTASVPLGTRVRFAEGATLATAGTTVGRGTLAYSSWRSMRKVGTTDADICAANDFALVRVGKRHVGKVDPTVPTWGGPTGLGRSAEDGTEVYSYGQSSLRPDKTLSPKTGLLVGTTYDGWGYDVYTATPGVPGDSGSGFLDAEGRAIGTLSTVAIAPLPGSNGLGNLARELRFAREHSGIEGLRLVKGGAFTPVP